MDLSGSGYGLVMNYVMNLDWHKVGGFLNQLSDY